MAKLRRRDFLVAAGAALTLSGCGEPPENAPDAGASGDPDAGTQDAGVEGDGGTQACAMVHAEIAQNTGHSLSVPTEHVQEGAPRTYDIQGTSWHPHTVQLTAAHFASLAAGETVVVSSSNNAVHSHQVTVRCH